MKLSDFFSAKTIAANWSEASSNRIPYLGEGLFPSKKKAGIDLKWIKGYKGLPISLKPSNFDADVTFRDRITIDKFETELAFFREGKKVNETDELEIQRIQDSGDPYATDVINRVFDDAGDLISGALVVPERMRMQLLSSVGSPSIAITANDLTYTYNYDPDSSFATNNYKELLTTAQWSAPTTCDPLKDLGDAQDAVEAITGTRPTIAIMSLKTFNYMKAADKVKSAIYAASIIDSVMITKARVMELVKTELGINIVIYGKKFKNEAGTIASFYPDDFVTLIPEGSLGNTWFGTTPEERSLIGTPGSNVSIVETGIAVNVHTTPFAPIVTETSASEVVLPSFERMDECYVYQVA